MSFLFRLLDVHPEQLSESELILRNRFNPYSYKHISWDVFPPSDKDKIYDLDTPAGAMAFLEDCLLLPYLYCDANHRIFLLGNVFPSGQSLILDTMVAHDSDSGIPNTYIRKALTPSDQILHDIDEAIEEIWVELGLRTPSQNDSRTAEVRHLDRQKQTPLPVVRQLEKLVWEPA